MRKSFSIAAMSFSSLAFSTKACAVMMVSILAARQAPRTLAAPALKLIMAGTRPPDNSASTVTAAPLEVGSMTPSGRPSAASGISLAPRMRVACNSRL